jgi:hypothetical protein
LRTIVPLTRQSTPKPNEQVDQKDDHQTQQHHQLHILPPHPPLERTTPDPKVPRILSQPTRLIDQRIHVLSALQHPLNILRHNLPHAINLPLRRAHRIVLARLGPALLDHHALEHAIEARAAIRRQIRKVRLGHFKLGKELLFEVRQEAKGDALAEPLVGDDEKREAAGAGLRGGVLRGRLYEGVDVELCLVDGGVGGGFVGVVEAWEDEGDEGGGVGGGGGGVFGEDGRVVGYAGAVVLLVLILVVGRDIVGMRTRAAP